MKLIRHLTWQNMKQHRSRTVVTIIGIILSAAMFTAVATMGVSFISFIIEIETANSGDYFVRYDYGDMDALAKLRNDKDASRIGTLNTLGYAAFDFDAECESASETVAIAAGNSDFFEMLPVKLEAGRLPEAGSEIVITRRIQEYMKASGIPCEIGSRLTLPVKTSYPNGDIELPTSGEDFEATYTIVGVSENDQCLDDYNLHISSFLTFDDGRRAGIWGRFFVKTDPRKAYEMAEKEYGLAVSLNSTLLELHGITKYRSINDMITSFAATLMGIIMVGAVSLIYNAFSISVSERTRQFGLLSSVGATRRQIMRSVFTEAFYLSAAGIPLGILSGYAGIAVTLKLTHGLIDGMFASAVENGITIHAVACAPAFLIAGAVALVTVFISAWVPARRATRITPIAAIRETQEFKVPRHGIHAGRITQKLFGLPAALARKYYTVNKRKYRSTVISLTISMVLFVSAGTLVYQMNSAAEEQLSTDNFDFSISVDSREMIDRLRAHPALKASALTAREFAYAAIPEEDFAEGYRKVWNEEASIFYYDGSIGAKHVNIMYLEDSVLESFLKAQKIDPAPYIAAEDPLALVTSAQLARYERDAEGRLVNRQFYDERILDAAVKEILLVPSGIPEGVSQKLEGISDSGDITFSDGKFILNVTVAPDAESEIQSDKHYAIEVRPEGDGTRFAYYICDPETGRADTEPADIVSLEYSRIRIGESISELPMGIRSNTDYDAITVILPLSSAPDNGGIFSMAVSTSDYEEFLAFLKQGEYNFTDYMGNQIEYRNYITMIRIFSYGFIALISLICICNVFNTISTNVALRQKDFGMLRSVGMKNREINHMLAFECLQYGLKAMLFGIPLSLLSSYLMSRADMIKYVPPIKDIAFASGCIFITVFVTMFYAFSKLRKQNPIDAIRSES